MAKESGLGDGLFVNGYDLSGDIQQVNNIGSPRAVIDVTGINKSAFERVYGVRDGVIEMTTHFNTSAGQQFPTLKSVPDADSHIMFRHGSTLGNPAAALVSKRVNFDMTRGNEGAVTFAVGAQSNGYGLEWGNLLTAGVRTDTSATNGTAYDFGADQAGFFDAQAYLHVTAFTGTDCTITIQSSQDNGGTDPFSDRLVFTAVTSAHAYERKAMTTPGTQVMERYVRVKTSTSGGFSSISFVVMLNVNRAVTSF